MAKSKPKAAAATESAEETAAAGADPAEVKAATTAHADAAKNAADLREALAEAEAEEAEAKTALDALTNPPAAPITGPRIKIENGPVVAVKADEVHERRLLLFGKNFEHVSETMDQEEEIWVYRQM